MIATRRLKKSRTSPDRLQRLGKANDAPWGKRCLDASNRFVLSHIRVITAIMQAERARKAGQPGEIIVTDAVRDKAKDLYGFSPVDSGDAHPQFWSLMDDQSKSS